MTALLLVAANELRQRLRDRSVLVMAFVAPLALTALISAVPFDSGFHATFVVADEDGGLLGTVFAEDVLGATEVRDVADIVDVNTADSARQAVADGRADAAFILPRGFSEDASSGTKVAITVITRGAKPIAGEIARSIATGFGARIDAVRLASQAAEEAGRPPPDLSTIASDAGAVAATPEMAGGRELTSADYFAPAMAILFLFFTVGMGSRSLLVERAQGTLTRLRASPVSPRVVLGGKALASLALGLVSMLVVFGASAVLLGARWGNPLAVLALIVAVTIVATAITWLLATLAATEEQATAYTSIVATGLALLGGSFFPLSLTPEAVQRLAVLTPNGQALQGFTDLTVNAGPAAFAEHLAIIGGFTLVVGAFALTRSNRLVRT